MAAVIHLCLADLKWRCVTGRLAGHRVRDDCVEVATPDWADVEASVMALAEWGTDRNVLTLDTTMTSDNCLLSSYCRGFGYYVENAITDVGGSLFPVYAVGGNEEVTVCLGGADIPVWRRQLMALKETMAIMHYFWEYGRRWPGILWSDGMSDKANGVVSTGA